MVQFLIDCGAKFHIKDYIFLLTNVSKPSDLRETDIENSRLLVANSMYRDPFLKRNTTFALEDCLKYGTLADVSLLSEEYAVNYHFIAYFTHSADLHAQSNPDAILQSIEYP
ncbi:hypothetical protein QAD02_002528 [Eretmocerus hayati]|uniref:Uncharacterized protein n=1 Tax=Eretmocerus hayati TaxID=131215 RepID=A0ACC2NLU6_9HYME|nr:hypothetical protein QAD02_002528 [Eretmocerus hayati]